MPALNPDTPTLTNPTDRILNEVASELSQEEIQSPFIQGVIDSMFELSTGKGADKHDSRQMVGLAAVQLGVAKRIVTIDMTADGSNKPQDLHVLINPKIVEYSEDTVPGREGCWSCGDICGNVDRSKSVTLHALDRKGTPVSYELTDFVARIAQHEVDHLNGIRFPDRIPTDQPKKLHLVLPSEFPEYRLHWATWVKLCPREDWESMKTRHTQ
jgi:peptide deformylase